MLLGSGLIDGRGRRNSYSDQQISEVARLLKGWIWETDRRHRFSYMSDSVLEFTGKPPAWHYGKTWEELGNKPYQDACYAKFQRLVSEHRPFGPIEFLREQDGSTLWIRTIGKPRFDADGTFSGYFGIEYNAAAEMHAVESHQGSGKIVAASVRHLQCAVDKFACAVALFDGGHRLTFANDLYYEALGLSRQRFPSGTRLHDIVAFQSRRGDFIGVKSGDLVEAKLRHVEEGKHFRIERTCRDGRKLEVYSAPLSCGGHLRTYADVTMRVEMNWRLSWAIRELQSRDRYLEHVRELATVTQTLANSGGRDQIDKGAQIGAA